MWILTSDGHVNSDHVIEISSDHSGEKSTLKLVNGKTAVVLLAPFELLGEISEVIPAQPGFELLYLYDPGGQPAYGKEPIIAWRISGEAHESRIAITPSGSSQYMGRVAILYPDGQVHVPYDARYPNIEAWIVGEREELAARKAQKSAA